jgi:hypothetical protein
MKRMTVATVLLAFVALTAWLAPGVSTAQDSPTAVLTSLKGPVTVTRADGSKVAATFGLSLGDGDEVKTGAGAEAEIMFAAGNWVQIGANSAMKIKGHPAALSGKQQGGGENKAESAENFEVVQNFLKLKSSEGTSSIGRLRAGDKTSALVAVAPCQTKVRGANPSFRWKMDDPSQELRLTVYNESGVVWTRDLSGATSLDYPSDAPSLAPGVSYSWTLETTDPLVSPPLRTPAAFFEVIAPEAVQSLEGELAELETKKPGAVTYHLMRASMFFDRGLVDDAVAETEAALAADPGNASLHAILGRLYAETGRTKDAINELNKAQQ